jgi:hypothetical protein
MPLYELPRPISQPLHVVPSRIEFSGNALGDGELTGFEYRRGHVRVAPPGITHELTTSELYTVILGTVGMLDPVAARIQGGTVRALRERRNRSFGKLDVPTLPAAVHRCFNPPEGEGQIFEVTARAPVEPDVLSHLAPTIPLIAAAARGENSTQTAETMRKATGESWERSAVSGYISTMLKGIGAARMAEAVLLMEMIDPELFNRPFEHIG